MENKYLLTAKEIWKIKGSDSPPNIRNFTDFEKSLDKYKVSSELKTELKIELTKLEKEFKDYKDNSKDRHFYLERIAKYEGKIIMLKWVLRLIGE